MSLTDEQFSVTRIHSQVLTFLLSPQPWEANVNVERISAYFATLRQQRGLTLKEAADQMEITERYLEGVEYGIASGGSQFFENYIRYAQFLGITLQEVFEATMLRNSPCRQKKERKAFSEEELLQYVYEAVERLKDLGKPLTQRAISEMTGISRSRLKGFPQVKSVLARLVTDSLLERRKRREAFRDGIAERVRRAIKDLEALGVPITQSAISERVGLTLTGLKYYPEIKELIEQYVDQHSYVVKRSALRELELVAKIEAAIVDMQARHLRVTQTAISQAVGRSLHGLKKNYPLVKTLLEQFAVSKQESEKPSCEDELYERVEEAIRHLKDLDRSATLSAISKEVGMPLAELRRYPRVKTLLEQNSSELSSASRKKSSANEDRILAEVRRAISRLESGGVRITQKAISEAVGKPVGVLRRYPRVRALLMQVAAQDRLKQLHSVQANLHEDELVAKLEEAVGLLESRGELVTERAVSSVMGLSATALYFYPKIVSKLNGIVNEKRRQGRLLQAKTREDDLVTKVLEATERLQLLGQPITVAAVARVVEVSDNKLRHYPRVKEILKQFC